MYLNKKKYEDGMILKVDKPIGWTSFDIVNKIRNTLKLKKNWSCWYFRPSCFRAFNSLYW